MYSSYLMLKIKWTDSRRWVCRRARCRSSYRWGRGVRWDGSQSDRRSGKSCRQWRPYTPRQCLVPRQWLVLARRTTSHVPPPAERDNVRDLQRHTTSGSIATTNW